MLQVTKQELDLICYALEKHIQIYEEYDISEYQALLKKLMKLRWNDEKTASKISCLPSLLSGETTISYLGHKPLKSNV